MALVTIFSDNFNRADNTQLGTMWDSGYLARNNLRIVSNVLRPTVFGASSLETLNAPMPSADHWIEMTVTTKVITATQTLHMLLARAGPPPDNTWYEFQAWNGDSFDATRITREIDWNDTGGTLEIYESRSDITWVAGDVMRFEARTLVNGNVDLRGYRNGVQVVSHVDSDPERLLTGSVGMAMHVDSGGNLLDAGADHVVVGNIVADLLMGQAWL